MSGKDSELLGRGFGFCGRQHAQRYTRPDLVSESARLESTIHRLHAGPTQVAPCVYAKQETGLTEAKRLNPGTNVRNVGPTSYPELPNQLTRIRLPDPRASKMPNGTDPFTEGYIIAKRERLQFVSFSVTYHLASFLRGKTALRTSHQSAAESGTVYVSYSWTAERETQIVDSIKQACIKRGIGLQLDSERISYGASIKQFMDELAAGRHVILVLSEHYFKSPNCMYELREVSRNPDFRKRVYPIVLRGTNLYEPLAWVSYLKYWEDKEAELDSALKTIKGAAAQPLYEALNDYADFRRYWPSSSRFSPT